MAGVKAPTKTVQLFQLTCFPLGHKVSIAFFFAFFDFQQTIWLSVTYLVFYVRTSKYLLLFTHPTNSAASIKTLRPTLSSSRLTNWICTISAKIKRTSLFIDAVSFYSSPNTFRASDEFSPVFFICCFFVMFLPLWCCCYSGKCLYTNKKMPVYHF